MPRAVGAWPPTLSGAAGAWLPHLLVLVVWEPVEAGVVAAQVEVGIGPPQPVRPSFPAAQPLHCPRPGPRPSPTPPILSELSS